MMFDYQLLMMAVFAVGAGFAMLHIAIAQRAILFYLSALVLIGGASLTVGAYYHNIRGQSKPPEAARVDAPQAVKSGSGAGGSGFGVGGGAGDPTVKPTVAPPQGACASRCGGGGRPSQVDDVTRLLRQFNLDR